MSEFTDRMRDKWESITPRERLLVLALAVAVPLVLVLFLGSRISGGLEARETRIAKMRRALVVLADLRARGEQEPPDAALAEMTSTPVKLETYVAKAAETIKIAAPNVTPRAPVTKDNFITHAVQFDVRDLTVAQAKDLLEALETRSKLVVVTSLTINRKFRDEDKDKLDLKLEVSTYSRVPTEGDAAAGGSAAPAGKGSG
jgi:hypothetical protein